jgi:glycosyltransferase involved in cell wall biosynthesis
MHDPAARVGRTGVLDEDLEAEFPDLFGGDASTLERAGIELMGARALADVYSDLKAAAVAVVNCNWRGALETFCRSAVDAQMAGTPVVGAARGSLPEVVAHERSGLLVEREDPEALAQAIILLLKDRALRQRMGTAGRTWARQFADYAAIAGDWEAIGRRALRNERAPAPPRAAGDLLRRVGYGTARLWARGAAKRLLRWS